MSDAKKIAVGGIPINVKDETARQSISDITAKIPSSASSSNQLSDKAYVSGLISAEQTARASADTALQGEIDALKARGRFLALWHCATGLPFTNPTTLPYTYKTGDYFIVGDVATSGCTHNITLVGLSTEGLYGEVSYNVTFSFKNQVSTAYTTIAQIAAAISALGSEVRVPASGYVTKTDNTTVAITNVIEWTDGTLGLCQSDNQKACITNQAPTTLTDSVSGGLGTTNYKPDGSSYTGVASAVIESDSIAVDDVYYYDGTNWNLQQNSQRTVSFSAIAGQPSDNANLSAALNAKVNSTSIAPAWAASTDYAAGDFVTHLGALCKCSTTHTSGSTFDSTKWTVDTTLQGEIEQVDEKASSLLLHLVAIDYDDADGDVYALIGSQNITSSVETTEDGDVILVEEITV